MAQSIVKNTATAKLRSIIIDSLDDAGAAVALVQANLSIGGTLLALQAFAGTVTQVGTTPQHVVVLTQGESDDYEIGEYGYVQIETASGALPVSFPFLVVEADISVAPDTSAEIATAVWADADGAQVVSDTAAILADTGTDGVVVNAAGLATDAVTEIVAAIFSRAFHSKMGSYTYEEITAFMACALLAKISGAPGSEVFRNLADNADVITATTTAAGRSAVTLTAGSVHA